MAKILLVEDNDDVREAINDVLMMAGHEVTQTYDGSDAEPFIIHDEFDVMVTDIMMPNKNGFDLINDAREKKPAMKIVAISGGGNHVTSKCTTSLANLSVDASLVKPFTPEDILSTVDQIIRAEKARQA